MKIIRVFERFIKAVAVVDGVLIVCLALMICTDIILRMLGSSVYASVEMIIFIMPVIAFLSVGYTMLQGMHIKIEIVRLEILDRIMNTLCTALVIVLGYYCGVYTTSMLNQTTVLLKLPKWIVVAATSFGMFLVGLALILNEIKYYIKAFTESKDKKAQA